MSPTSPVLLRQKEQEWQKGEELPSRILFPGEDMYGGGFLISAGDAVGGGVPSDLLHGSCPSEIGNPLPTE